MCGKIALLLAFALLLGGCGEQKKTDRASPVSGETGSAEPEENRQATFEQKPAPEPVSSARIETVPAVEEELLRLINGEREKNGLPFLVAEAAMGYAARVRAEEALASLSHTRPDETPYHTAFREAGFDYIGKWHGENLAVLTAREREPEPAEIAAALFREYLESPGHHSNLLSEHFTETGVGVCLSREGEELRFGAAQMFAGS